MACNNYFISLESQAYWSVEVHTQSEYKARAFSNKFGYRFFLPVY